MTPEIHEMTTSKQISSLYHNTCELSHANTSVLDKVFQLPDFNDRHLILNTKIRAFLQKGTKIVPQIALFYEPSNSAVRAPFQDRLFSSALFSHDAAHILHNTILWHEHDEVQVLIITGSIWH